jgi:hypothetical protein
VQLVCHALFVVYTLLTSPFKQRMATKSLSRLICILNSCQFLYVTVMYSASNMFVPYRVPVKSHLREGSNELLLTFPSTYLKVFPSAHEFVLFMHNMYLSRVKRWRRSTANSTSGTAIQAVCMSVRHNISEQFTPLEIYSE